jgi:hypothetical protein
VRRLLLGLVGLCLVSQLADAAEPPADCARIDDDRARLACYDAASGRGAPSGPSSTTAVSVPAAAPVVAAPTVAATTPAPAKEAIAQNEPNFGLSAERQLGEQAAPKSITATVVSVTPASHIGRWVVALDNGQAWEQRETTSDARRPRPGDTVTIRGASLGSFLLTSSRGASRVRRIR